MSASPGEQVRLVRQGPVTRVLLARPEVRNAFDDLLIAELTAAFDRLSADKDLRVVILSGEGQTFCAGADISWMRRAGGYSREENEADAQRMARMLLAIDLCPKPVIALVRGAALGGGVGLVAAADIAIAADTAFFSLAEAKLGILPSVISPYVLRAIGPRAARDLFLTADRIDAREAHRLGLIHEVTAEDRLEAAVERKIDSLLSSGPQAVEAAKQLIAKVTGMSPQDAMPLTVQTIAQRRASEEAREGLTAFLEKRRPSWSAKREEKT